jgi:hypothetical protein
VSADLFTAPAEWNEAYDLVIESCTLQVLPPDLRPKAIMRIARFVAPNGMLLVIARGRDPNDHPGNMPWPLIRSEIDSLRSYGLAEASFEDYVDAETPPVRRFRAVYIRPR